MEIVDSYLIEVGQFLPEDSRQDILAELKVTLEEEISDSAEQAGEDPDVHHAQAVLQRFGHPLKVASEYQPVRYLIGPDLYPAFLHTLRVLLTIASVGVVVVGLVLAIADGWQVGAWSLIDVGISLLFWILVVTTGVFVAIEYSGEKLGWYENWKPQRLASGSLGIINRGDVITNLVTEGVFLLWWNDVLVLPNVVSGDAGDLVFNLGPVWADYFWPFNVLIGACFLLHLYVLIKGVWQRPTLVLEITSNTALVAVLIVLVTSPELVVMSSAMTDDLSEFLANLVNRTLRIGLLVICGFCVWDMWTAWRHFKGVSWRRSSES